MLVAVSRISEVRQANDGASRVAVWAVWTAMAALLAGLFSMDATNVPLAEDWLIVPAMTGNETDFGGWLWSQNNEHRVPWPRLVMLAILRVTGGSFQAIGWFNLA